MSHPRTSAYGSDRSDEVAVEARLLRDIADGDPDAFRALWDRYGGPVYRLCLTITGDSGAADDAVQETFLRIWRRALSFDPARGVPAAWIMTVARNAARTAAHARPLPAGLFESASGDSTDMWVDRMWLRDALGELSPPERLALELAYFADLSHTQVAARLGEPLGTVKARIRRALVRLSAQAGER